MLKISLNWVQVNPGNNINFMIIELALLHSVVQSLKKEEI